MPSRHNPIEAIFVPPREAIVTNLTALAKQLKTVTLAKMRKHCEKHGITLVLDDDFDVVVEAPPHHKFVLHDVCSIPCQRIGYQVGEVYAELMADTINGVEPCDGDCENDCEGM